MDIKTEMYAWVTVVDGRDSLIGAMIQGQHVPLVATSRETIERVRHLAVEHGIVLGQPVRLVHFREVETLQNYPAHAH